MPYALLDNFTRPNEIITASANYDHINQDCVIQPNDMWVQTNRCGPLTANSINDVYWTPGTGSEDNIVGLTYVSGDQLNTTNIDLWVRVNNPGQADLTGYMVNLYFTENPGIPTQIQVDIYRYDDCATAVLLSSGLHTLTNGQTLRFQACANTLTFTHSGGHAQTVNDSTYLTGEYIGFGAYGEDTLIDSFGGGTVEGCCEEIASATIAPDTANTNLVCENQEFTVAYLPVDATLPITYAWTATNLVSGQGTATAVYNWTSTGAKTITCTLTNACSSVVATYTVTIKLTLGQIARAIASTLESYITDATILARMFEYDELPEGVQDYPSILVYWEAVANDVTTANDRHTMGPTEARHNQELTFHIDYYARQRSQVDESMDATMTGASEIIDALEDPDTLCPPFGLCGLKTFRWEGRRVVFEHGSVLFPGARFIVYIRIF